MNDYSLRNGHSLSNSIANGNGFQGMTTSGSPWQLKVKWTDREVWDRDLLDSNVTQGGLDNQSFDQLNQRVSGR